MDGKRVKMNKFDIAIQKIGLGFLMVSPSGLSKTDKGYIVDYGIYTVHVFMTAFRKY